jgi:hypothetical protein
MIHEVRQKIGRERFLGGDHLPTEVGWPGLWEIAF